MTRDDARREPALSGARQGPPRSGPHAGRRVTRDVLAEADEAVERSAKAARVAIRELGSLDDLSAAIGV